MSIEQLKLYDKTYRNGFPITSDRHYDDYRDKEFKLNPDDPYFKTVGAPVDDREKVKLPFILGSLKKTKLKKDDEKMGSAVRWIQKQNDFTVVTPKLDGNSILVNFSNGIVASAFRRGDGEYGQNITNIARKFIKPIKSQGNEWIRGEVILESLPQGSDYKHKTAAVAGILNDAESQYHANLKVLFYEHINSDLETESGRLIFLRDGIQVPTIDFKTFNFCCEDDIETILTDTLKEIKEQYNNKGFEIDGLVLAKNISKRENVKRPEHKVAFKVNQEAIETTVVKCKWDTSRKGRAIPVLLIDPIEIGGSTISKVTAHNYKYISDNNIGIGTKITVVKSGEVIPYIVDVYSDTGKDFVAPDYCESCGDVLTPKGVDLVCINPMCSVQSYKSLEHFLKTIGVMGISKTTLINLGVSDMDILYNLTVEDIMKKDGFGEKKANTIVNELKSKLVMDPAKFLAGLGISGLGNTSSKLILKHMSFDKIWETGDFSFLPGIGKITSDKILKGLDRGYDIYNMMLTHGMKWKKETKKEIEMVHDFYGNTVTLTGKAPMKRAELVGLLEDAGCTVKGISKNVDFLVTNDVNSGSSKATKARGFGVPIITYKKLLEDIK